MDIGSPEIPLSPWQRGQTAVREHLKKIKQPIDYALFTSAKPDFLLLGETHTNTAIMDEIALAALAWQKAGITSLAVEAPRSEKQLELFARLNRGDFSQMEQTILGPWGWKESEPARRTMAKNLVQAGIQLVPIDIPDWDLIQDNEFNPRNREAYLRDSLRILRGETKGPLAALLGNRHVLRKTRSYLQGHQSTIQQLESEGYDYRCLSVVYTGGRDHLIMPQSPEIKYLTGSELEEEDFMYQPLGEGAPYFKQADWLIHLPKPKLG